LEALFDRGICQVNKDFDTELYRIIEVKESKLSRTGQRRQETKNRSLVRLK
jgi:hypothetical protein